MSDWRVQGQTEFTGGGCLRDWSVLVERGGGWRRQAEEGVL